jgi:hypothetical protein
MPGPVPKPAGERRNRNAKIRGEWIEIREPTKGAPPLPKRGNGRGQWSARTRKAWKAWWKDPASTQWGPGDIDLVEHLADVYEEWIRSGRAAHAGETRQLRDQLGLSPKGKQDRRWKVAGEAEVVDIPTRGSAAERMEKLRRAASTG